MIYEILCSLRDTIVITGGLYVLMFCFKIFRFCFSSSTRFAYALSTVTISSAVWLCLGVVVFLFLNY